ncbi:hypothetical protein CHS0354_041845 [Potamilus streckersoni]|uniref:TIR domain-containing protein n=1 Tax=Potamilus streckersoni TaxID=2493646 RepID=A0AAE0T1R6_9BIVA|nr:hypothetical protein CHS0354_041845 [Potamilus streckersoni]
MYAVTFVSYILYYVFTLDICFCNNCSYTRLKGSLYLHCNQPNEDEICRYLKLNKDAIVVSVTHSGLTRIPSCISVLTKVQRLDLSYNYIKEIDSCTLNSLGGTLTIFVMNYNYVSVLRNGSFDNLTNLQEIYLQHNNLQEIETNAISSHLESLYSIQFSFNQLEIVDLGLIWVPKLFRGGLVVLNLSSNAISNCTNYKGIGISGFSLNNSFLVDLTRNNLTTIDINYLLRLVKLEDIEELYNLGSGGFNIVNNPLVCDCLLFHFSFYISLFRFMDEYNPVFTMACYNPPALRGRYVYAVPIQDFNCSVQENCPHECLCTKTVALDQIKVTCDKDLLESLPYVIPEGKKIYLSVHSKNVQELSDRMYFKNVTNLDLSSSSISTINEDFLHNFQSMNNIYIYDNSLRTLPEGIQNMNLENLTSLYLHGNPFQCDCHTKWMKAWLQKNRDKIPDLDQVFCEAGQPNGKRIIDALDTDFVCDSVNLFLVLAVSFGGLSALVILFLAVHCFREAIQVYLIANYRCFQCLRRKVITNLPFDIFISYSSYDETYVQEVLIPQLENDSFRLFTQDNFIAGIPIVDNILNGIDSSFTTLIVLSNKFLESEWCRYEFQQAYDKVLREKERHLIILILDNELNNEIIPRTLKLYLKTNNYINVLEKRYMSRLLLALPRIQARSGDSERTPLLEDQSISN